MKLTRRHLISLAASGAAGALVGSCTGDRHPNSADAPDAPSSLAPPTDLALEPMDVGGALDAVQVHWADVRDAQSYDVEVNGFAVATGSHGTSYRLGRGDGASGLCGGTSSVRVRARAGHTTGEWSPPQTFTMSQTGVVRVRGFDLEDDGDIDLTLAQGEVADSTAALRVGEQFAYGGLGKGLSLTSTDGARTKAYKNHDILPIEQCWIRFSFSPRRSAASGKRVQLARINDRANDASERLVWVTGEGVTTTSVKAVLPVAPETWVQLQFGVDQDGKVELWAYDGTRETLMGTGRSTLLGATKDRISIGNADPNVGITFEAWLDDVAVGESRLPWMRHDDPRAPRQLQPLVPDDLPPTFTFVFGSCSNSNHVPASGTSLEAAAATEADFVLHLGDLGYVDSGAYRQSLNGYLASWNDLFATDHMARLGARPWVRIVSDHDMGGNDVTAATVAPYAVEGFARFNSNDRTTDPAGRYGSVALDAGHILLVWTEGIQYRSRLNEPNAPDNTKLGPEQKAWLLNLLSSSTAKLIVIASETALGHQSNTGWTVHPAEREELLRAFAATGAHVRVVSGDLHHATLARFSDKVAEWGAAAMSEFPETAPHPTKDLVDSGVPDYPGFHSRPEALDQLTVPEFNATTTFGHVSVDTVAATATFELRRADGTAWTDSQGRPMSEVITYG